MIKRTSKIIWRVLAGVVMGIIVVFCLPSLITREYSRTKRYPVDQAPVNRVAIVFGAGLLRSGAPSPVLRDRIEAAVQLYKTGKVEKLLMSGDNRFIDYNEPAAMGSYAAQLGVASEDIVLDYAGRRTYDTCYRARYIFGVQEAILVTQNFHMPRALYTCNQLGVKSVGVPADGRYYLRRYRAFWAIRETLATTVALWELWVSHPLPVLGNPEPIFHSSPTSEQFASRTLVK